MIANNIVNNIHLLGSYVGIVGNNIPINGIMTHTISSNDSEGTIGLTITFSQSFVDSRLTETQISKTIIIPGFAKIIGNGGIMVDSSMKPMESKIYVKPSDEISVEDV